MANRLRGRVVGIGEDERRARVGLLAQRHRERDLAQQRHVELVGERLAAALAEELEALAGRGREAGHVLDDAGDLEWTLPAICAARRATFCAVGCGVVTMTNCAWGSSWASVIETSPVPGGRSTSR